MPAVTPFTIQRRVEFRDTDAAGIMHFSVFFNYMEEAEHELLRSLGLSVVLTDAEGPISWPRVSVHCDYRSAVRFEDPLQISVRLARLGSKSATFAFVFTSHARLVAEGEITAVCCRLSPHAPPRSIEIPDWIRAKLLLASDESISSGLGD